MNKEKAILLFESGSKNYRKICQLYNNYKDLEMKGFHVHHKDGNHKNNNPFNLLKCTPKEHAELHKSEQLINWISLQNYAAVKGGKIAGKIAGKNAKKQMFKVWGNYSEEERIERIKNINKASNSEEKNKSRSLKLTGVKKPERTSKYTENWKKSKSIGVWSFREIEKLSANELAREINIPISTVFKWCKFSHKKIGLRQINAYSNIFNINDMNKTFKQIGFDFNQTKQKEILC